MCCGIGSIDKDLKHEIVIGQCFSCGIQLTEGDLEDYGGCPECDGKEPLYHDFVAARVPCLIEPEFLVQQVINNEDWNEIPF